MDVMEGDWWMKGPGVMEMLGGVAGAALCRTALSQAVRGQVRQPKSAG